MGIRFYCPNGHKLNVKTFLAGKRGICPKCGEKFEIPLESVRAPGKKPATEAALPEAAILVSSAGGSGPPPIPVGLVSTGTSPAAAGASPISAQQTALPMVRPFAPLNTAPSPGFSPAAFPSRGAGSIAAAPMGAMRAVAAIASPAASAPDPIAESPAAIWYVRPASGGQFGPAAGDIMRQWLTQRRVGADSMVWREGWPEWKKAAVVFPSLGGASSATVGATAAQGAAAAPGFAVDEDWVEAIIDTKPSVGHHSPAHLPHARAKGKQSNTIVIISFFLILLCVLLGIVMVTVIMRQSRDGNTSSANEPPARAAIRLAAQPAMPLVRLRSNT